MYKKRFGVSPGCHVLHYHHMYDTWAERFVWPEERQRNAERLVL